MGESDKFSNHTTQNNSKSTKPDCVVLQHHHMNRAIEQMRCNTDVNSHMWRKRDLALNTQQLFLTYCSAKTIMTGNFTQTPSTKQQCSTALRKSNIRTY